MTVHHKFVHTTREQYIYGHYTLEFGYFYVGGAYHNADRINEHDRTGKAAVSSGRMFRIFEAAEIQVYCRIFQFCPKDNVLFWEQWWWNELIKRGHPIVNDRPGDPVKAQRASLESRRAAGFQEIKLAVASSVRNRRVEGFTSIKAQSARAAARGREVLANLPKDHPTILNRKKRWPSIQKLGRETAANRHPGWPSLSAGGVAAIYRIIAQDPGWTTRRALKAAATKLAKKKQKQKQGEASLPHPE